MMDAIVRATCPTCGSGLRIPVQWIGQTVKCKKCGAIVRSKPKAVKLPDGNGTAESAALDATTPLPRPDHANGSPHGAPHGAPPVGEFDFSRPAPLNDEPFPLPEPSAPPAPEEDFDMLGGGGASPAMPMPPGYPYPAQPGYPPPGGYAPPPGYPYGPQPGYPYAPPPGYGMPGYPYPLPPGYAPPGGYAAPAPGYPYGPPPDAANPNGMPPASSAAPLPGQPQHALPNGPTKPSAAGRPPLPGPGAYANPNAQRPGPAPSPMPLPDPVPPSNEFKTDARAVSARRYRRQSGKEKVVWLAIFLLMTGLLGSGGIYAYNYLNEKSGTDKKDLSDPIKLVERLGSSDQAERDVAMKALRELGPKAENALKVGVKSDNPEIVKRSGELLAALSGATASTSTPASSAKAASGFPRRLLFIHISKYMFLNPLTASAPGAQDKTKSFALKLTHELRVPNSDKDNSSQLFFLSDTAPPERGGSIQVPMKNVVTGACEKFFETSRAQDHIVVYFGGHALEKDGKTYLAPIEGDLDEPETLIPLEEFYAKMQACKATQKVVIWDVCRFNPETGRLRPGAEPMTETLAKSLAAAPPGIEVVMTCQAGENAMEFVNLVVEREAKAQRFTGSAFLESAYFVSSKNTKAKAPNPGDPIPVAEWIASVGARVSAMTAVTKEQFKQTVKIEGAPPASFAAYNPEEAVARRFELPQPPKGTSVAEIKRIESEFHVPPIDREVQDLAFGDLPFKEEVMKDYKFDVPFEEMMKDKEKYKFQLTVLQALKEVSDLWSNSEKVSLRSSIGEVNDNLKKELFKEMEFWAIGSAKLALASEDLKGIAELKASQPKRWQAHYDYARAVVNTRLAYMNEYDKLLGDVRTETLPPLDKALGQDQYRLVHTDKMKSKKDVQKIAEEAQEAFNLIITEHKGTPWALQAKRERSFPLGLMWRPSASSAPEAAEKPGK
jgi:hypothetical protein